MEYRAFALKIFEGQTLEDKLFRPPDGFSSLSDENPGEPLAWTMPGREKNLEIAPKKMRKRLPSPKALHDLKMRARCLHIFANHELMALELMAWAILAFTDTPRAFRRGLIWLIEEEQRHFMLYQQRLLELGLAFGDEPLNDHFLRIAQSLDTPLKWCCAMNLTFEQANLDHAPVFADYFRDAGDQQSADLMTQILDDEIKHVGFGVKWLAYFGDNERTLFENFAENLTDYNAPSRAQGHQFNTQARRRAGLDDDFIDALYKARR